MSNDRWSIEFGSIEISCVAMDHRMKMKNHRLITTFYQYRTNNFYIFNSKFQNILDFENKITESPHRIPIFYCNAPQFNLRTQNCFFCLQSRSFNGLLNNSTDKCELRWDVKYCFTYTGGPWEVCHIVSFWILAMCMMTTTTTATVLWSGTYFVLRMWLCVCLWQHSIYSCLY